jgi:hypothetical protein
MVNKTSKKFPDMLKEFVAFIFKGSKTMGLEPLAS